MLHDKMMSSRLHRAQKGNVVVEEVAIILVIPGQVFRPLKGI